LLKFENENEMIMWMLAVNGYKYPYSYSSINNLAEPAAVFADEVVEEFRKRMPEKESE
jgi:hypothetical protein